MEMVNVFFYGPAFNKTLQYDVILREQRHLHHTPLGRVHGPKHNDKKGVALICLSFQQPLVLLHLVLVHTLKLNKCIAS